MSDQSMTLNDQAAVFAIATMDTKAEELDWVAACLRKANVTVITVDVSTSHISKFAADVTAAVVGCGSLAGSRNCCQSDVRGVSSLADAAI